MMKLDGKEIKRLVRSISIQTLLLGACFLLGAANFQNPYELIIPAFYYILGVIASIVIFVKTSKKKRV